MTGRRAALVVALAVAAARSASAGDGGRERPVHEVRRATSAIAVDGALSEPAWHDATVVPIAIETRPAENAAAPVGTECLLAYDDKALYVAFRAHDPDPSRIRARLSDRDRMFSDDFVGVVLDTFDDERRAFEFFVNPLGVQGDMLNDEVGGNEDSSWDALWESKGHITGDGFTVEMAIPFSSLRFPRGGAPQTWGIDMLRFYPRDDRHRLASQKLDRNVSCYLCQASRITGMEGIEPGRNVELDPTVTASAMSLREPDGVLHSQGVDADAGLTAGWGVTPNLTLNGAINPDFSQVEADAAQLDVNTQFALYYPEKRPFFLEGADFFQTALQAVFTRNVADPLWGAKLSGKEGQSAIGVFVAEDEVTNVVVPGPEGSSSSTIDGHTLDAVVRYRRDVGSGGTLGALFTSREGDDYQSRLAGVDGRWRFTDSDTVSGQLLASSTHYPSALEADLGIPDETLTDWAARAAYDHSSRNWYGFASYEDLGSDFRADLGFIPQVGYRKAAAGGQHMWQGGDGDWYQRIDLGGNWALSRDQDGNLLLRQLEGVFHIQGPWQSFIEVTAGRRDRGYQGTHFDNELYETIYVEATPVAQLYGGFFARLGDGIDFANVRPGNVHHYEPFASVRLGRHLRFELNGVSQQLDVSGGRLYRARILGLRAYYQLTVRSFVRAVVQYEDVVRDPSLYTFEVDARERSVGSQLLFSYKLNPRTVLFAGYSDDRASLDEADLTQTDRTVFLKLGYAWVL
ncbi:MAG: DUF5916 domain-containing protein [Acidobacteriota bacterium]